LLILFATLFEERFGRVEDFVYYLILYP
jgi:hypothetical protein